MEKEEKTEITLEDVKLGSPEMAMWKHVVDTTQDRIESYEKELIISKSYLQNAKAELQRAEEAWNQKKE